jgi:hypothetical protein
MKYEPWSKADRRSRAWKHNALLGQTAFSLKCMNAVAASDTATPAARQLATSIQSQLHQLREELKTRVD